MNRIRRESGMLVGQDVYLNAQKKLVSLLEPLRRKKEQYQALQKIMDGFGLKILSLELDASVLKRKFEFKFMFVEREFQKIEQILDEDDYEQYLPHMIKAKEDVLNKYCTFKRIVQICKDDTDKNGIRDTKTSTIYPRSHFLPKPKLSPRVIKKLLPKKVINFIKAVIN
jgi:hypothetical protein